LIEREKAKEKEMVVKIGFKNRKERKIGNWNLNETQTKHRG